MKIRTIPFRRNLHRFEGLMPIGNADVFLEEMVRGTGLEPVTPPCRGDALPTELTALSLFRSTKLLTKVNKLYNYIIAIL